MKLSAREWQVAMLVAQGAADKEVARRLGLAYGTVKVYAARARLKVGARDRADLAVMFARGQVRGPAVEREAA